PKPKGKVSAKKPKIEIKSKPKVFRIAAKKGGFSIVPAGPIDATRLPIEASLSVAYDLLAGNPFKKYSPIDFDIADMQMSVKGVVVIRRKHNELKFEIADSDFRLELTGFDDRRDI